MSTILKELRSRPEVLPITGAEKDIKCLFCDEQLVKMLKMGSPQLSPFPTQPSPNSAPFSPFFTSAPPTQPSTNSALYQLSLSFSQLSPMFPQLSPRPTQAFPNSALFQLSSFGNAMGGFRMGGLGGVATH